MCGLCGGGWGSAPDWRQAGSRALGQQRLGCQRGSGRALEQPSSYSLFAHPGRVGAALCRCCYAGQRAHLARLLSLGRTPGRVLNITARRAVPTLQPWHAAKRYPGLRAAHSATRSPPRLMLAGGSLRSPPAPPSAAACRPARGVAAGTVCAIMQGQAAPLARRRCRPCIIAHPVPYRGHGRTSPVGQRARCRSRLVAGPPPGGARPPGPVSGLGRAARP